MNFKYLLPSVRNKAGIFGSSKFDLRFDELKGTMVT